MRLLSSLSEEIGKYKDELPIDSFWDSNRPNQNRVSLFVHRRTLDDVSRSISISIRLVERSCNDSAKWSLKRRRIRLYEQCFFFSVGRWLSRSDPEKGYAYSRTHPRQDYCCCMLMVIVFKDKIITLVLFSGVTWLELSTRTTSYHASR